MKSLITSVLSALALAALTTAHAAAPAAKPIATAPAAAASGVAPRAAAHASKERSTQMGACQKQANDAKLNDVERKTFLVTCINQR